MRYVKFVTRVLPVSRSLIPIKLVCNRFLKLQRSFIDMEMYFERIYYFYSLQLRIVTKSLPWKMFTFAVMTMHKKAVLLSVFNAFEIRLWKRIWNIAKCFLR